MTLNQIMKKIAMENRTTPGHVRREMEAAMEEARKSSDPAVQARWAAIPHKGNEVTPEELVNYIASVLSLSSRAK